jgi:tRNA (cytidine/uridine-2'-O-)-methyltransferase
MDYRERAATRMHASWAECRESLAGATLYAVSTRGARRYDEVRYAANDALVFGPETRGLPQDVLESFPPERRLRIPMAVGSRSLNLSNAVTVVVYEAWRQLGFAGLRGEEQGAKAPSASRASRPTPDG